jgi:hypothetical protein
MQWRGVRETHNNRTLCGYQLYISFTVTLANGRLPGGTGHQREKKNEDGKFTKAHKID